MEKGADGQWRYLNGEGYMAVNAWADSDYYVDSNGIMVTDKWLKTTSDGGEEEWYYFGSSGKTIDDTWKKINDKWYHFDGNGRMETGWILDDMYYTGDDGVMRTGWQKLYPPDNYEEDSNKVIPGAEGGTLDYGEDGQYWYYLEQTARNMFQVTATTTEIMAPERSMAFTIALMMTAFYRWAGRM